MMEGDTIRKKASRSVENPVQISDSIVIPQIIDLLRDKDLGLKGCEVPVDRPLFQPNPSQITLQGFSPFKSYELVIQFKNMDKVPRKLRVEPIDSFHFSIHGWKTDSLNSPRVAPGMEVPFILKFNPEENVDYVCDIVCLTERERFILPIQAIGARGLLDIPDQVSFGECPVRFDSSKILLIRNIGECPAKFNIQVPAPFYVTPEQGYLEVNQTLQLEVHFHPKKTGSFKALMKIIHDTGEIIGVDLTGTAENVNIRLEKSNIRLDNTSITLVSHKTVRIQNRSDVACKFRWKEFATDLDEEQFRSQELINLIKEEEVERSQFENKVVPAAGMLDLSLLSQKYKNRKRVTTENPFLFSDDAIILEPAEGVIWPGSFVDVKVHFVPNREGEVGRTAYCEIEGRESRLPLHLKGEAVGPKARFSYDVLDMSTIFINTPHQYEVILENRGDIPTQFTIGDHSSLFGPKFSFKPSRGDLAVGEQKIVLMTFCSDILGQINEEFEWKLEGASEPLRLGFKGVVVGPTFKFDKPILDFEKISYGFSATRTLNLVNTSHIPMKFVLRFSTEDADPSMEDLIVSPATDVIHENSSLALTIKFKPGAVKKYATCLIVDIEAVGTDLLRLPIYAESIVPEINVKVPIINMGDCYTFYNYNGKIVLVNRTPFSARYKLKEQEVDAKSVYSYVSQSPSGIIKGNTSVEIDIEVQVKRLGQVSFPIFIQIEGRETSPLPVDIDLNGKGPDVVFSSLELVWGRVSVLKKTPMQLTLTNQSPIMAEFTAATVSEPSVFHVEPLSGRIPPGESINITVTAFLDDTVKFTDMLKVGVPSDGVHDVQLVARGQGTTIVFDEGLRNVEFKDVFSNCECSTQFVVSNKGRRTQSLHWAREEATGRNKDVMEPLVTSAPIFEVIPSRFTLKPGCDQVIMIKGYSNKALVAREKLVCQAMIDKDPSRKLVLDSLVTAKFINPLMQLSPSMLKFEATHLTDTHVEVMEQILTMTNTTSLPLTITLKCPPPFKIRTETFFERLAPNEVGQIAVVYDPSSNINRISSQEHGKLLISYREHPQKDVVELYSHVSFPNLSFSVNTIRFGCIPKDIEQRKSFFITNSGVLPVNYQWYFVGQLENDKDLPQVFDIQPNRGLLEPGEVQDVDVVFYGQSGRKFDVKALCDVIGGPKYEISLQGEASVIEYAFDRRHLDFGAQSYQAICEHEITLTNTGLVSFDFNIIIPSKSMLAPKVMVSPGCGTLLSKGKQKLLVRFCPCVPEATKDVFYVQIAHFQPVEIHVAGVGVFPRLDFELSRLPDPVYDRISAELAKKEPKEDIASETDRKTLSVKTIEHLVKLDEDYRQKLGVTDSTYKGKFSGSIILFAKGVQQKLVNLKEKKPLNMYESSFVKLARYSCDFGTVVRNSSSRKTIKIFNSSDQALSFSIDRTVVSGSGFNIEPDKVKSLPPGETLDLHVGFAARHNTDAIHVELPISVAGGPLYMVHLSASVTVPEISIVPKALDFGEVLCGMRKTMFLQLQNLKNVVCEWSCSHDDGLSKRIKKKINVMSMKEFDILPTGGIMQPNEKVNVMIRFSPSDERDFELSLPIRVLMNPTVQIIELTGKGIKPALGFDRDSLSLGPVLPYSDGIEARFTIQNLIKYPLEVYSVDFDHQLQEEEDFLRHYDGFDNGVCFVPPRVPGSSLPDFIVTPALVKMRVERKEAEDISRSVIAPAGETLGEGLTPDVVPTSRVSRISNMQTMSVSPSFVGQQSILSESASQMDSSISVIVHGLPFSGRTTQAKRIAQIYGKTYLNLDELLESVSFIIPTDSKMIEEESSTPPKSHKDEETDGTQSEESLLEQIKLRLSQRIEVGKGYVIDGLESKTCQNHGGVLKAILRAFADKGKKITLFVLTVDLNRVKDREAQVQKVITDKELELLHVKELTEEEYDMLPPLEREKYDGDVSKYKKRLKEIEARRNERRHQEEEYARTGDRKGDDDKSKGKKARKQPAGRPAEKIEKAPNTQAKPEGKAAKKAPGSPKGTRKAAVDRDRVEKDKSGEKSDRAGISSNEKDGTDDGARYVLGDESFIQESTYRRVEAYINQIDAILSLGKEVDKTIEKSKVAPVIPAPNDKKPKATKPNANDAQAGAAVTEGDAHGENEVSNLSLFEVTSGPNDEETIFKLLAEHLPPPANQGSADDNADQNLQPILEQILYKPMDKPTTANGRFFSIISNFAGEEEPVIVTSESPPSTALLATPPAAAKTDAGLKPTTASDVRAKAKMSTVSKPLDEARIVIEGADEELERESIAKYRWVLQPGEKRELAVRFNPTDIGKFDQILSFETTGFKGKFYMPCKGICQYSHVTTDFRKIFSRWRRSKDDKSVVHGEYVVSSGAYEFGPLLFSKPREKYLERFPENRATFKITNPGAQETRISFALRHDAKGDVFFFDPQTLDLAPGQTNTVSVWAYPRAGNHFEDLFVVSVRDNPEPFCFKISCIGVKPELEVDKKTLSFDKLLLSRTEKREIKIKNPTFMAVAWKLVGVDALGEEFKVSPIEGIVESFQECTIVAEFQALRPVMIKRVVKLEVNDVEKIGGTVQDIPILVTAEAYDIAMDLHFPKGAEGGLDFGVLKVAEEGKQLCTLKNKGKYEVGFKFMFDDEEEASVENFFVLTPSQGVIQPSDKPFFVQIVFKSDLEITIKENNTLKCVVFEPTTGEVTATISIKISARAVFSKFSVLPVRDLNFGALIYGSKLSRQFTVENFGEYDFKYNISKIQAKIPEPKLPGKAGKARAPSPPPQAAKVDKTVVTNKKEPVKQADTLSFGAYTVFPTSGIIPTGTKQPITVEFHADTPGSYEEIIGIDISDRSPTEHPDVLEYRLIGESCVPGVNTTDFTSIFEEQSVCRRLELFNSQSNVYAEEDRVFYFGAYLAGQEIQVHFKISNPFKVPCDVTVATRPRGKSKSESIDFAFDVEPKKMTIPSHEYRFIAVTFHPTSIQSYAGLFEAIVDNVTESKFKTLSFELRGEGTLPRITVEKPVLKSKTGFTLLRFKKLLVGSIQTLHLVLKNDGIIPANFKLEWVHKDNDDFECKEINNYHTLKPSEYRSIEVKCRASAIRKLEGELRLKVQDNTFEDQTIQVMGEGYLDDLTFEGLSDEVDNEILFSDCAIGETKQISFRLKNHSTEWLKIAFPEHAEFAFSPMVSHSRPKAERDITVSFTPKVPVDIQHLQLQVKVTKIRVAVPPEIDWDDRMKSVRWLQPEPGSRGQAKKVVDHYPEPHHEIASPPTDYALGISALADVCSYECDVTSLAFKSTLMFQSRIYRFSIRNSGRVVLLYNFYTTYEDGSALESYEDSPFSITPQSGSIPSGEISVITIRFSPLDVGDYKNLLVCAIPNLAPSQKPLSIPISGSSLRPFCHFELEDSDYIASERRTSDRTMDDGVPIVLEPSTKVIEFSSCGIKSKNTKRFYIVNPTNLSYEFEWTSMSNADNKIFKCNTPRGIVSPGKKSEVVFEFNPESIDIKEALWSFTIVDHNIKIPFLLVGHAHEPNVYMDHTGVNFKSVLVGRNVKEIVRLTNDEDVPFSFNFNETSFEVGLEGTPVLRFSPNAGVVGPRSNIPIEVVFSPSSEKMFNFNLVCNIRKKPTPVTINVKGEGYEIHESLQAELPDGSMFELAQGANSENILEFGQVQVNEKRVKRITIINSGKFNFDFAWKFPSKQHSNMISIIPDIGTVMRGERIFCEVIFKPPVPCATRAVKANCLIINGRSYPLTIMGAGTKPLLKFSVNAIDFGPHVIYKPGMQPAVQSFEVTNADVKDISFDVISPDVSWMEITRGLNTLAPGEKTTYTVTFYPKEHIHYFDNISFEVNSLSTVEIGVKGEGSEFKVEAEQKNINFGALRVGYTVLKTVKITNKGKLPVNFSLGPASTLEVLSSYGFHFTHMENITLRSKGTLSVDMKFIPHHRISPFAEEIFVESPGIMKQLFVISGACQGTEVRLENDTLPFGAVVQQSSTNRRIQLQNVGDIGAKFYWDISQFKPDFSISPAEGYISPGMEIPLEISFHPNSLNPDIRYENIPCQIEGMSNLYLTLTGMCVPQPAQTDLIKFAAAVRSPDTKSISLTNKTSNPWHLRPVIENEYWTGAEVIDIEPSQTKSYDITFLPLETLGLGEGGKHEGSIFFPLPDGTGILYRLNGLADKPVSAGNINREIPCKTQFTEVFSVNNWLKRPQRFRVITEVAKVDPSVIIKGHDFIDVPPLLNKEYKLGFYAYKEGVTNVKVIFKNETSQEYSFYNLVYKSTAPGVIATFDMTTSVRQVYTKEVVLFNPLLTPATFNSSSNNPDVSVPHQFVLQPRSDGNLLIEYLPLQPKDSTARITLTSTDLGVYQYDLKLLATASGPERSLHFKVGLGVSQDKTFIFVSFAKTKTDYSCKIDSADFMIEKSVTAPAASAGGSEVSIDITYEPSKLGDTRTQLIVSSPSGGDYACPLYGHCIAPRPQGPIFIKPGASSTLPFKNVFSASATFNFVVDNASFIVKAAETIAPKKTIQLTIGYKQATAPTPAAPVAGHVAPPVQAVARISSSKVGKLTITHSTSNMSWVYYLRYTAN